MLETSLFVLTTISLVLTFLLVAGLAAIKENGTARALLLALLLFGAFYQVIIYLKISGRIGPESLWYEFEFPFQLGSISLLYAYVCSFTDPSFNLSKMNRWHLLPFLLGCLWCLTWYFWFDGHRLTDIPLNRYVHGALIAAIEPPYLFAAYGRLRLLKHDAKDYSSSLSEMRLPWLRFLLGIWFLAVFIEALDLVIGLRIPLCLFASMLYSLELLGLTFYGLRHSRLFTTEFKRGPVATLNAEELVRYKTKLINYIKENEPYLKPQIHLTDLAEPLGLKNYLLSEVINRGLGTTFYDLINGLRVEKAKGKLRDPAYAHLNLLGIAMECGFNSKSSFNESFRQITGMTPSQFRDQ